MLTEDGTPRKYPAGTMFSIHKNAFQTKSGKFANVSVHLGREGEPAFLGEMEYTLRHKIMKAENRQRWMRTLAVGASIGLSVELARRAITFIASLC